MSAVRPAPPQPPSSSYSLSSVVPIVQPAEERPVAIEAYARAVLARWPIVIAAIALGALAGWLYSLTRVPMYRSSIRLIAVPSQVDPKTAGRLAPDAVAGYVPFATNYDVLQRAIKAAGLDGAADRWKVGGLSNQLKPALAREAPILTLVLDFPDPQQGGKLLAAIAQETVALNRAMVTQSDRETREFLKARVDEMDQTVRAQERLVREFKDRARFEERRKDLDTLLAERSRLQVLLTDTQLRISEWGSTIATLEKQLEGQPATLTLKRSIVDDPGAAAIVGSRPGSKATVESEVLNPIRDADRALVDYRARLAGARSLEAKVQADVAGLGGRITALAQKLSADEIEFDRVRTEMDSTRRHFASLTDQHRASSVAIAAHAADLKVFEGVRTTPNPVAPKTRLNVLYGGVAGLLGSIVLLVGLAVLGSQNGASSRAAERVAS